MNCGIDAQQEMELLTSDLTRLISIVSKPIKLICGQTSFDEKIVKKVLVKKALGLKNFSVN